LQTRRKRPVAVSLLKPSSFRAPLKAVVAVAVPAVEVPDLRGVLSTVVLVPVPEDLVTRVRPEVTATPDEVETFVPVTVPVTVLVREMVMPNPIDEVCVVWQGVE
jgi:hypothetical protein